MPSLENLQSPSIFGKVSDQSLVLIQKYCSDHSLFGNPSLFGMVANLLNLTKQSLHRTTGYPIGTCLDRKTRVQNTFARHTGCHLSSSGDCCERTAPVTKSELSASTLKGRVSSRNTRIGAEITQVRMALKADFSASPHCHVESFRVRSNIGRARSENPWMKRR